MNSEKKLCLIVASFTLILFILNMAPTVESVSGADDALDATLNSDYFVSDILEPLETTLVPTGTLGWNNWYTSDVTVTFSVLSSASSVTTAYSFDEINWVPYTGAFVISTEGITTIYFNSTDSDGLVEATKSETIQIDKTAPRLSIETEIVRGEGVLVTITAIEDVTSLIDVGYSPDGIHWSRYTGPFMLRDEGMQPVYYRAQDTAGNLNSKFEYVDVIILPVLTPTDIIYSGDTSGVYSDPISLEATLFDSLTGLPVPDKWIVFTVGSQGTSALTDADGIAQATLILNQPAEVYEVSASFAGDDVYLDSLVVSEFTIFKESATLQYSGLTIFSNTGDTLTLMATAIDDADGYLGNLSKVYVTFTIFLTSEPTTPIQIVAPIMVEPTDAAGFGIASAVIPNLPEGEYLVVVSLNPDHNPYYSSPDSEYATITVYEPNRDSAMGAGWITDADGNRGHFAFMVRYSCNGVLKGFAFYKLRVDNIVYFLKTTDITGFSVEENHAFFEATAVIFQYDLDTEEWSQVDGSFRIRIDVWASKRRCGDDIFQIRVYDERGLLVYQAGIDSYVERGNVIVKTHPRKHRHRHHH